MKEDRFKRALEDQRTSTVFSIEHAYTIREALLIAEAVHNQETKREPLIDQFLRNGYDEAGPWNECIIHLKKIGQEK